MKYTTSFPVPDEPEEVETRQQCSGELDIGFCRLLDVIAAEGGVGSGQDGDPGVECRHDSSLNRGENEGFKNRLNRPFSTMM